VSNVNLWESPCSKTDFICHKANTSSKSNKQAIYSNNTTGPQLTTMECGSYKVIKLLEHAIKVVERIFECIIQQQTEIDNMQFGFIKGKGTTDAIFIVRQNDEGEF